MQLHPFDLQARAALAARSLTTLLDPQRDGLMYFLGTWRTRPPRADHCLWDCGDGSGRHIDALTLARDMLPATWPEASPDSGEAQLEAWMMRLIGIEGLTWLTDEPWSQPWGTEMLLRDWQPNELLAEISWAQRGTLLGLTTRFLHTGDERYRLAGQHMIDGLLKVAARHDDGLYYPEGYYRPSGWHFHEPGLYAGIEEYNAAAIVPSVRFYAATGYAPALELAEGLARFALKRTRGYLPDGRLRADENAGGTEGHFHTRSNFMLGVLELGVLTSRREYVSWARQSYDYAREWGTEFGWFPEGLGHRHGEICCTTDMIEIALLLGRHVSRDYYADAERFGRNHLLESQFLSLDQLQRGAGLLPEDTSLPPHEGRYSTTERVAESQIGAFAARSTLNDAFHTDAPAMMQCCNAAGTRGLWDLWHHAVESPSAGQIAIHLRFSVETPAVRVVSHEPAEGRLDITPRQDSHIAARLPQGERQAVVVVQHGGATNVLSLETRHGYVKFDAPANSRVEVRYPLAERVAHYEVGAPGKTLRCSGFWHGETLMQVDPPGPYYPLYQRSSELKPVEPQLPGQAGLGRPLEL